MPDKNKYISDYGYNFQVKLITCLLLDTEFVGSTYDLIKNEYFESESFQYIIDRILEYYKKAKKIPTFDVLKVYVDGLNNELLKMEVISVLKDAVKQSESTDLDFIKDTTIDFCKRQEIKNALIESIDLLQSGQYEKIGTSINNSLKIGTNLDIGYEYFEDFERRYTIDARVPITTGWDVIDELMKGGLAPRELGVIVGGTGAGKSFLLGNLGAAALRAGKNVLHYSLELDESYVSLRYDSILTGIPLDKLHTNKENVQSALKKIPGNLIVKWFPMKSVSLIGLQGHLNKLIMTGHAPDIIIIDYAELLKYSISSTVQKHDAIGLLFEELKGMAGEYLVPIWTASQGNKGAAKEDIIESDGVAGAYSKIFPIDFGLSISRKIQDKVTNTARAHIMKNRMGPDGMTFPVEMDTSRGLINIHNIYSSTGQSTTRKMQSDDDYNREALRHRISQLNEDNKTLNNNLF